MGGTLTVRVAALLVWLPAALATLTVKVAPLSPLIVGGVVYVELVAPLMAAPVFDHW
jgi:hypothetical protein